MGMQHALGTYKYPFTLRRKTLKRAPPFHNGTPKRFFKCSYRVRKSWMGDVTRIGGTAKVFVLESENTACLRSWL
jgi:hypothetical protein